MKKSKIQRWKNRKEKERIIREKERKRKEEKRMLRKNEVTKEVKIEGNRKKLSESEVRRKTGKSENGSGRK